MHYTTNCNTQSSAPEDGQNNCPKHVELIGIINKPLLLHLVGCLYYCISDARSNKHLCQTVWLILVSVVLTDTELCTFNCAFVRHEVFIAVLMILNLGIFSVQIGAKVPAVLRFAVVRMQGSPFDYPEGGDSRSLRKSCIFVII